MLVNLLFFKDIITSLNYKLIYTVPQSLGLTTEIGCINKQILFLIAG